jgi:hypothetical protein
MTRCVVPTLVLAVLAPLSWADTVNLVASKDNTLFEAAGFPDLSSGRGDLFGGGIAQQTPDGNAYRRRALVQFNLSSIPAGATITGASLRMQVTRTPGGAYQFNVYRMLASWGESTSNSGSQGRGVAAAPGDATWNFRFFGDATSAWTNRGGDFDPSIRASQIVGGTGTFTWSGPGLVADVQGWLNGTIPNNGWMLTADQEFLTSTARRFASRESTTTSFRPTLIVQYTPRPPGACVADFNGDGDARTDADIEAFFACLAGACCGACGSADFDGDGSVGTDADIEAFFRVLAGGAC